MCLKCVSNDDDKVDDDDDDDDEKKGDADETVYKTYEERLSEHRGYTFLEK